MIQILENADYIVTTDWEDETISKSNLKRGHFLVENDALTIKAGSIVDVSGVLYRFADDETPTNPTSNNTYYVYLDTTVPELVVSSTAPSYDPNRDGYYNGATSRALLRFIWSGGSASKIQRLDKDFNAGNISAIGNLQVNGNTSNDGNMTVSGNMTTSGNMIVSGSSSFNTQSTSGTATFNGTILDKNGQEVLALRTHTKRSGTVSITIGNSATMTITFNESYIPSIKGIAFISVWCTNTGFDYAVNPTDINFHTTNKTVSATVAKASGTGTETYRMLATIYY